MEVNEKIIQRWIDVYWEKAGKVSLAEARLWFFNFVPDENKARVMHELKKGRPVK